MTVRINRERLWGDLMRLKEIGGYDDAATGLRGVRRLALTDEDAEARRLVVSWMREAGLRVRVDRIGNVYGERAGEDPALPCVLIGRHIDSVSTGGAFDGTLGVRFGTDMLGSAVTAGRLTLEYAHHLTDAAGAAVNDELVRIVGNLAIRPAQTNVIPAEAVLTVDLPYVRAVSGAGHDAQEIAATCPTAMVFVAGEYGGISHTPREYSSPDACGNGIDVLANAVLELAS